MSSMMEPGSMGVGARLAAAAGESRLLEEVASLLMDSDVELAAIASELVTLHNSGRVDVVEVFGELANDGSHQFFMIRSVFEEVLPALDAGVTEVMNTVVHLCREGGQDLAAGTVVSPFMAFCEHDVERPREAIALLSARPADFGELLSAILVAGAKREPEPFFEHARRLSLDGDLPQRQRAVLALGRLASMGLFDPDRVLTVIGAAYSADNCDEMRASVISSCGPLTASRIAAAGPGVDFVRSVIEQGGDHTLYASSQLLWLHGAELPQEVAGLAFNELRNVNPQHSGTIRNIDRAVSGLLRSPLRLHALATLRNLLESSRIAITDMGSTMAALSRDDGLGALATEWFASGKRELCSAIGEIVQGQHQDTTCLSFDDSSMVAAGEEVDRYFVGKRAVGFLFAKPKVAIGFLCSLLAGDDSEVDAAIRHLILDPMLINYPGSGREALASCREAGGQGVQRAIDMLAETLDEYLQALGSTQRLRALEVPEVDRESYRRYLTSTMEESMKAAEKKSAILSLFHRSTLLYGRSAINTVFHVDGSSQRMEVPMATHAVSVEFPRMSTLDPVGLDFRLRVLRNEPRP